MGAEEKQRKQRPQLDCIDCENRYPGTFLRCQIYRRQKPKEILDGSQPCPRYKSE